MPEIEHRIRVEYKYTALSFEDFIQVQHELTLLPKAEIRKALNNNGYVIKKSVKVYDELKRNPKRKDISQSEADIIIKEYCDKKLSVSEIANIHNMGEKGVYTILERVRDMGLKIGFRRNATQTSNQIVSEVLKMKEQGNCPKDISEKVEISLSSVYRILRKGA